VPPSIKHQTQCILSAGNVYQIVLAVFYKISTEMGKVCILFELIGRSSSRWEEPCMRQQ